ncbi:acyltransferase [bacterium]|nr:acyltransferase [bacterium]
MRKRIYWMDWLRVLATAMIVLYHFGVESRLATDLASNAFLPTMVFGFDIGQVAVSLFFMLSGAALMYVYGESDKPLGLRAFFVKRVLDILPYFWVAYALDVLAITMLGGSAFPDGIPAWRFALTVVGMDGYTAGLGEPFAPNFYLLGEWFIGCLIFLYALAPAMMKGVRRAPALTAAIVVAVAIAGAVFVPRTGLAMDAGRYFTTRAVDMLVGMLFIHMVKTPQPALALTGCGLVAIDCLAGHPVPFYFDMTIGATALLLAGGYLFSLVRSERANTAVTKIASVSYPVFLTHHRVIVRTLWTYGGVLMGLRVEAKLLAVAALAAVATGMLVKVIGDALKRTLRAATTRSM